MVVPLDDRAKQRGRTAIALSRRLRSPEFRADHPREMTIIPVRPDDAIDYLLARLDEAESPAALAILSGDGVRLVSLRADG